MASVPHTTLDIAPTHVDPQRPTDFKVFKPSTRNPSLPGERLADAMRFTFQI